MVRRTLLLTGLILPVPAIVVLLQLAWLPDVSELRSANPMATKYVGIYVRRMLRKGDRPVTEMTWVPLERISPHLRSAVVVREDTRFYEHRGVDWTELRRVVWAHLRHDSELRGASTITQQVARNLFLSPERTLGRKLREVFIARHLERNLGKARILEIYLNIAEWGEGAFGAEAASRRYYRKAAADLTPEEAVRLAIALGSPYVDHPLAPRTERLRKLEELYLDRLRRWGYLEVSPSN